MKKLLTTIAIGLLLPFSAFALSSSVDRITDHIEPLIKGDFIKGQYFQATSTTATSTFAGGVNITGGGLKIATISGILKAVSGVITTALVNLASDVTGTLPVANGGTGSTTLTGILKGNGTSQVGTAVAGTDYQAPVTLTTTGTSGAATFSSNTLNIPQYAGTTYTATYPVTLTGSAFGLDFGTTTSNTWAGTQTFTNPIVIGSLSGLLAGNSGTTYAAATSAPALSSSFAYSGTLGSFVGGAGGTLSLAANGVLLNRLNQVGANTLLGNATGATANVTAIATSSLGLTVSSFASPNISQWTNNSGYITSAITAIGPTGQTQTGATQTLATSTGSNNGQTIGITIVGSGNTQTFTPSLTGTLNNAGLTNSTISGVALGSTLNALTATNGSLTFSGSYDGSTARTVGLNVGNANSFTALQQFLNASSTLASVTSKLYVGGTATTTIDSTGNIVVPSGSNLTVTGKTDGCATWATGVLNSTGLACGSGGSLTGTTGQLAYFSGTNTAVGTSTLFITTASNVGVGTTSPSKLFTVEGNQSGGVARIQRDLSSTPASSVVGTYDVVLNELGGGALANLTGPGQTFGVMNSGGAENIQADISSFRDGVDTSGGFDVRTYSLGTPSVALQIDSNQKVALASSTPLLQIGSTTPTYGYLTNDRLNIVDNRNDYSAGNAYNLSAGNCATADWSVANDLNSTALNFGDLGHTSSGFTGTACANNPFTGFHANSTYLFDPSGYMNFALGSTSVAAFNWFTGGYAAANQVMTLTNAGRIGLGTTTPGTLLSLGNTGANTVNISATATSTFGSGINISTGCFAINGTCLSTGGSGGVTGTTGQVAYLSGTNTAIGTSTIFIDTNGRVGIGSTTPFAALSVNPTASLGSAPRFVVGSSSATSLYIDSAGKIGFGAAVSAAISSPFQFLGASNASPNFSVVDFKSTTGDVNATFSSGNGNIAFMGQRNSGSAYFTGPNGFSIDVYGGATSVMFGSNTGAFCAGGIFTSGASTCTGTGLYIAATTLKTGISTTSPIAQFTMRAASTTAGTANDGYNGTIFMIAGLENTVTKLFEVIDQWGHRITGGDTPTVSGGTSTVAGNDNNGTITVTGTLLTSVTLTFAHAWPTAPDCTMADSSTGVTGAITSISSTQVVIGFSAGVNSGTVWYMCAGHQ